MCIIIVKPRGIAFPTETILDYCFRRNPHGAGIMLAAENKLIIRKGLMSEDEGFRTFCKLKNRYPFSPFVFHFRWATDGGINPGLCHPFPIDNRKRVLLARQPSNVKIAVAHNGVIPKWSGLGEDVSDTFLYVKNDLFPALKNDPKLLLDAENRRRIAEETGSRLAFMNYRGQICTIGGFYQYNGIYYSKPLPAYL